MAGRQVHEPQDDAHIFCAREQLAGELASLLEFVLRLLRTFGLAQFEAELATRPETFVGAAEEWDQAEAALKEALDASGLDYLVAEGEGVFYAPKIDVHVRDAIGRRWQISTLQVDFQLPQRFGLEYAGADNARHRPFMIHRALFGSVERFLAIVLEHYAGALPPWLAPVQVRLVPVADRHLDYAAVVADALRGAGRAWSVPCRWPTPSSTWRRRWRPRILQASRRPADPWGRDGPGPACPTGCRPGSPAAETGRRARRPRRRSGPGWLRPWPSPPGLPCRSSGRPAPSPPGPFRG